MKLKKKESMMSVCIMIPIKTNNERLPGKNTYPLKDKPLFAYLFSTLKKVKRVDAIYVDSSDEKILKIAEEWGFSTLKRPAKFNDDHIAGDDLLMRVMGDLKHNIVGLLHVTSPFLKAETIEAAVDEISNDSSIDSLFGVAPRYNRFWFKDKPVNHDVKKLVRTQDLIPVFEEADFYFVRRKAFLKHKKRVCGKMKPFAISDVESTDIDTLIDIINGEALIDAGLVD